MEMSSRTALTRYLRMKTTFYTEYLKHNYVRIIIMMISILYNTEYRIQSTEYRVQSNRVQSTEYRVQSTEYRVLSTEYRVDSTLNRLDHHCVRPSSILILLQSSPGLLLMAKSTQLNFKNMQKEVRTV